MKHHILFLLLSLLLLFPQGMKASAVFVPLSNTNEFQPGQQVVVTNANQILLEVLAGTKTEGKKVYASTKEALTVAYESLAKEVPQVVNEFFVWRTIHHLFWAGFACIIASMTYYWSRRFARLEASCPPPTPRYLDDTSPIDHGKSAFQIFRYGLMVITWIFLLACAVPELRNLAQIKFAPRIYAIEYVVDTLSSYNSHRR